MSNFSLEKIKEFSDIQFAEPYNKPKEELLLDLEGFICEEMSELIRDRNDKVKVIDALADIVYFTANISFALGISIMRLGNYIVFDNFDFFKSLIYKNLNLKYDYDMCNIYEIIDTCLDYAVIQGIDLMPVLEIVHNANMAKFYNEKGEFEVLRRKEDGKILKPKHWQEKHAPEAKIEAEIKRQLGE